MTKADIKSGMVVEYRKGAKRLVVASEKDDAVLLVLIGKADTIHFSFLDNWQDDLTHNSSDRLDIVAVYKWDANKHGNNFESVRDDDLIWKENTTAQHSDFVIR